MSQTQIKTEKTTLTPTQEVAGLLFANHEKMVSDYKNLIKHTGSLVTASMVVAYQRALSDAIKLILKNNKENKDV